MAPLLQHKIAGIAKLCEQFSNIQLFVFGSAARVKDFSGASDIDLLATFQLQQKKCSEHELPYYFDDKDGLEEALKTLLKREVDLLTDDNMRNPYLKDIIHSEKILLYAAS